MLKWNVVLFIVGAPGCVVFLALLVITMIRTGSPVEPKCASIGTGQGYAERYNKCMNSSGKSGCNDVCTRAWCETWKSQ